MVAILEALHPLEESHAISLFFAHLLSLELAIHLVVSLLLVGSRPFVHFLLPKFLQVG